MEYLVQMVKSADTLYADKVSVHKQLSADFTYTPCGEILYSHNFSLKTQVHIWHKSPQTRLN